MSAIDQHMEICRAQWPSMPDGEMREMVSSLVLSGQCWLFAEPEQMRLF